MCDSLPLCRSRVPWYAIACCLCFPTSWLAAEIAQPLPLKRIVVYSSGVAFFEHEGEVEGTRRIDFQFKVGDINDLLKSMVLQDLSGGSVSTVTYSPREPISRTLKTFAVDLTRSTTLGGLLQQARGQKVRVDVPNSLEGLVVGVERQERVDGIVEFLLIKTNSGIRRIPLDSIVETELLDDEIDRELQQGLELLAAAHSQDHKAVTLEFRGDGKRTVRISYIQEFPIWKTSYRLVLNDGAPSFLQGWAIVENTSEQDWRNVRLGLVSGRPISFEMDLYQSLYVPRPVVVPDHYASLESRAHGQDLMDAVADAGGLGAAEGRHPSRDSNGLGVRGRAGASRHPQVDVYGYGGGYGDSAMMSGGMAGMGMPGYGTGTLSGMPGHDMGMSGDDELTRGKGRLDLTKGVVAAANADVVGELFRYSIAAPVDLPRRRSAMIPIVNEPIAGDKVYVYNPAVQVKHPMCAMRMRNTTGLHLMHGPITVFEGGEYAGDARIEDIPPDSSRLISFALDLDTEIVREQRTPPEVLVAAKIVRGSLIATHKRTRGTRYRVKNSSDADKEVLIEQAIDAAWSITTPAKPQEQTRDLYRFSIAAKSGQTSSFVVIEEQLKQQQFAVGEVGENVSLLFAGAGGIAADVHGALRDAASRRAALAKARQQRTELESWVAATISEQERVRENMLQLDRTSDLYRRYYQNLGELEDQIQELRGKHQAARKDESEQLAAFEEFVANLNVP